MPEPEAGLAAGVLIGLRDRVDRDLADAFTIAGASHVVAISGWNIAIVASTLGALAGGLQRRRRATLTAVAIVVYVAFVGPSPSVVRAGVMAGVALLARELGRPGTAAAALGWAITGLLLIDPEWAFDAGFRLSVLATAGIIAWGSGLTARLAGPAPSRQRRWVAEILGVSFAAQAATTPVVLFMFGRLSLVAPLVNLIVVPLVPPAMAAGALALVVGMLVGAGLPAGSRRSAVSRPGAPMRRWSAWSEPAPACPSRASSSCRRGMALRPCFPRSSDLLRGPEGRRVARSASAAQVATRRTDRSVGSASVGAARAGSGARPSELRAAVDRGGGADRGRHAGRCDDRARARARPST